MRIVIAFIIMLLYLLLHIQSPRLVDVIANDVSWPNCGPSVQPTSNSGIVGVNGGKIFTLNPCFDSQIKWFKNLAVYLNTGYPGIKYAKKYASYPRSCQITDESCLAYNYGFNSAKFSISYVSLKPVLPQRWWLDVETSNSWNDDTKLNRRAISGTIDALKSYTSAHSVGVYSAPRQWQIITGGWRNGLPAWMATGSLSPEVGSLACLGKSFTGGPILMGQYTLKLDENYLCRQDSFRP